MQHNDEINIGGDEMVAAFLFAVWIENTGGDAQDKMKRTLWRQNDVIPGPQQTQSASSQLHPTIQQFSSATLSTCPMTGMRFWAT